MRTKACARHYCGVCKTIGAEYGQGPRMLLNHDTVLVAEIMTALNPSTARHPALTKRNCFRLPNPEEAPLPLRYAAATTMLLASAKVRDHVTDTGKAGWKLLGRFLKKSSSAASTKLEDWGLPVAEIEARLASQSSLEAAPLSFSQLAAPTAFATSAVCGSAACAVGRPDAEQALARFGDAFGRMIYILDAWHDYAKDAASRQFNAIQALHGTRENARPELDAAAREVSEAIAAMPLPEKSRDALRLRFEANLSASVEGAEAVKRKASSCLPNCAPNCCDACCDFECCCDCTCCGSCCECGSCCDGCDCGGCDCS